MYAYVPVISEDELSSIYGFHSLGEDISTDLTKTNNGVNLILELYKSDNSIEIVQVQINKGTPVGTAIKIGNGPYIGIKDMKVELLDGQIEKIGNTINWSITDRIIYKILIHSKEINLCKRILKYNSAQLKERKWQ